MSGKDAAKAGATAAADKAAYGSVANKTIDKSVEMTAGKVGMSIEKDFDDIFKQEQFDPMNKEQNPDLP